MGIPEHITCVLRNLYVGQEATVGTEHETTDCFKIGKVVRQGCILSLCLFNFFAEYIMWNARLYDTSWNQDLGRNINNFRYVEDGVRKWRGTQDPLDAGEGGKGAWNWLETQHSKIWFHHFVTNRWGESGNSGRFSFLDSKIIAYCDCSHEINRPFLLGRKAMTNLDSVLKSRDITLPTKIHLVKAMVFPVVMHRCEHWTIKKAEYQRTDSFEL